MSRVETHGPRSQHPRGGGSTIPYATHSRRRNTNGASQRLSTVLAHFIDKSIDGESNESRQAEPQWSKLCVSDTQSHHPASLEILLRNLKEDQGIPRRWTNDKADRVGSIVRKAATGSHTTFPGARLTGGGYGTCFTHTVPRIAEGSSLRSCFLNRAPLLATLLHRVRDPL